MLDKYLEFVVKKWSVTKKWSNSKPRPFIEFAINEIEKSLEKNLFVIEAPTGYGKSTISATIALHSVAEDYKCIIAYPLRTLLEEQFRDFSKLIDNKSDSKVLGKRYMHNPDSKYLIKPITLTTVDTLSLNLFGIAPEDLERIFEEKSFGRYFFAMSSVLFSNLVLDEVHLLADSTKSLNFLVSLIKIAKSFDQKVLIMSATLPKALKRIISEVSKDAKFIEFEKSHDPDFCAERLSKSYELRVEKVDTEKDKILFWLKEGNFSKALVIFNTVDEAIRFYEKLDDFDALLIHSRFTEKDRESKVEMLEKAEVVVATQVVEAGLNISSDLLITDLAPASSLIQRFGRFLRYNENEGEIYVWFEDGFSENFYKVYSKDLALRTLEWLKKNSKDLNVHLSSVEKGKGYGEMLNEVYSENDFSIDRELVDKFEEIYLHLENAPKKAMEMLFEMQGSFVREGLQIPVTFIKEINASELSEFVKSYVVPISFETFLSLKSNVVKAFTENDGEIETLSLEKLEFLNWKFLNQRKLFEQILRKRILAFVVNADYDADLGLRWSK